MVGQKDVETINAVTLQLVNSRTVLFAMTPTKTVARTANLRQLPRFAELAMECATQQKCAQGRNRPVPQMLLLPTAQVVTEDSSVLVANAPLGITSVRR